MQKLKAEHAALQYELVGVRRQLLGLQAQAAPVRRVQTAFPDADADTLRYYAGLLAKRADAFAFVCNAQSGSFVLQTETAFDLQPVMQALRACGARGGGRGSVMQGSVCCEKETLCAVLEQAGAPQ